ncbi:heavy-metal-associated domain-containing protein [Streptomyces sp. NRRL S-337]|uniref:heavy-metal-associated domain-containing protein n=1 Tax=Streptomyces sp. NRRL S-337 TaxID=1463900 RepID=UPI0004CBF39B|nr:heavy-metal-associated domain-containing protein [Streptomyces sp. NRRL S-337]
MTENSSCCTPEGSCHSGAADVEGAAVTTTYQVTGMTCGHCEGAVSSEISEIPGVSAVQAVAATGLVTVTSKAPLDEEAVRAAVDEAGYELVGRAA